MLPHAMARTIAIVGAGRVGRALGRRFAALGWKIGAVVTRSGGTARAAVRRIRRGHAHGSLTPGVLAADVVLITTPDSAIAGVAKQLARVGGVSGKKAWHGKVVLHTSGALDRRPLAPLAQRGAATGSLHPLQTFGQRGVPRLRGILFAIEGDARARRVAQQIAQEFGGVPVVLEGRSKPAYHAAGAFAAPLVLGVLEAATRILMALGFKRHQATRALLLLARQTLENLERSGPRAAWTGPVSRGDDATVARHLVALRRFPAEYRAAYLALTRLGARLLAPHPEATLRRLETTLRKA